AIVALGGKGDLVIPLVRFLGVPDPLQDGLAHAQKADILHHIGGPKREQLRRVRSLANSGVVTHLNVPPGGNGTGVRLVVRARARGSEGGVIYLQRGTEPPPSNSKDSKVRFRYRPTIEREKALEVRIPPTQHGAGGSGVGAEGATEVAVTLPDAWRARPGHPFPLALFADQNVEVEALAPVPLADELPPPPPGPWQPKGGDGGLAANRGAGGIEARVTEQEKQPRRARRTREQARQALPTSNAAKAEAEGSAEPRGGEAIKDRNKRLRDEAARKRASKRRNRAVEATEGLDASERVDDALTRSAHAATNFVKKNASWLQWVFLAGAAGSIAYLIVDYRAGLGIEKESHVLMEAVAAQQGRIADNDFWRSPDPNLIDPRPEFASEEARLDAAEQRFRAAIDGTTKKGPQLFAHLGLAGVLFDRGKYADARAAYDDAA